MLHAASVVVLATTAAGRAAAETVMPSGSGVPVIGGGGGGSTVSVDAAVNQLVEAIKVLTTAASHPPPGGAPTHAQLCSCNDMLCYTLVTPCLPRLKHRQLPSVQAAGGVVQQGVDAAGVGVQYAKGVRLIPPYPRTSRPACTPY